MACADALDLGHRHHRILVAVVDDRRALGLEIEVLRSVHVAAVEVHLGCELPLGGGEPRPASARAEARHRHATGRTGRGGTGLDVGQDLRLRQRRVALGACGHALRRVGMDEIALQPIEQRRRDGRIAGIRPARAHDAHRRRKTVDRMQDDDAALRSTCRIGAVDGDLVPVRSRQLELARSGLGRPVLRVDPAAERDRETWHGHEAGAEQLPARELRDGQARHGRPPSSFRSSRSLPRLRPRHLASASFCQHRRTKVALQVARRRQWRDSELARCGTSRANPAWAICHRLRTWLTGP